jgi:hypothetical protein
MKMTSPNIPFHILFQVESATDLETLANQLLAEFQPRTQSQTQTWEELVTATWLRRRYEKVRSNLFLEKNQLLGLGKLNPAQEIRLDQLNRSIQTFQRELERQKKAVSDCRRLLRRAYDKAHYNAFSKVPQAA